MSVDARLKAIAKQLPEPVWRALMSLRVAILRLPMVGGDIPRLARFFNTSKKAHDYFHHYATHLGPRRRERLNILEIGIGGRAAGSWSGESLRLWQAYFRNSMVYGIDKVVDEDVRGRRIRVLQGTQSDVDFLTRVGREIGSIDVVIDDGSHVQSHIRTSFEVLFPYVAPGGYYIIEDLQTSYLPRYGGAAPGSDTDHTAIGLVKGLLDGLHHRYYGTVDYVPTLTDEHVAAVHVYEKIAFIQKLV
jgi:hypothetical protein